MESKELLSQFGLWMGIFFLPHKFLLEAPFLHTWDFTVFFSVSDPYPDSEGHPDPESGSGSRGLKKGQKC